MQTFLKSILILHENREKSKLFKQIYRLKLAFSHTSCIYFTELHLTFHLTWKMEINILTNYQLIVIIIMVMQMENKQISSKEQVENFLYFISFCEISGE